MAEGLIVKALSGFYYVEETATGTIYECRGRGVFRNVDISPLVGDHVVFQIEAHQKGYITEVFPRKNELVRPPIANVDQVILVFSVKDPDFNQLLLDRFLAIIESCGIEPVIVLSKCDLLARHDELDAYIAYYRSIGYQVLKTNQNDQQSIQMLLTVLDQKISVLAGQSGVGKSSLINAINPMFKLQVDAISKALGRGKHTTRHVELFKVGGGFLADTPGFSKLSFKDFSLSETDLAMAFRDYFALSENCKFRGCLHLNEPQCAVKAKLGSSEVYDARYQNYQSFQLEIQQTPIVYLKKSK